MKRTCAGGGIRTPTERCPSGFQGRRGERRIILDTKFYRDALARGRGSGTGKLHSGNLYQLLAYLRNRQANRPDGARHAGILLYPQVGEEPLRADIRLEGFRIRARTVDLNRDWRLIHDEMLRTINCDPQ